MKRIIALMIVVALSVCALTSCDLFGKSDSVLDDVATMYSKSSPTKVVATTVQKIGSYELDCSYEIVNGYVDNRLASVYTSTVETLRNVDEGGANDEVKDMIKTNYEKIESIEGFGSRTNGGDWNPEGSVWTVGRGRMAINLVEDAVTNVQYDANTKTLTFVVPAANVATVFGADFSASMSSDVEVKIVNDGANVTSIDLHYYLAGDGANLERSEMTVSVVYTYDLERITIE